MSRITEQKQKIEDVQVAQYIMGALRDVSATELSKLMKEFQENTVFHEELRELFRIVWHVVKANDTTPTKQPRVLYVAYTTNKHFYGSINRNIIQLFTDKTGTRDECLIIGKTGKSLWKASMKKRKKMRFISFTDDIPTDEEIGGFLNDMNQFDRVFVFYPRFVSVFEQVPDMVDISFFEKGQKEGVSKKFDIDTDTQFLLEPEIDKMLVFFSTQVRRALFEHVILETHLSRVAARLIKMDTAEQNAKDLLQREYKTLRHMHVGSSSRQMLETLIGYLQWHKINK